MTKSNIHSFRFLTATVCVALLIAAICASCGKGEPAPAPRIGADGKVVATPPDVEILNVSYDPTRELYQELNPLFAAHWKKEKGQNVTVKMSHGGAGKQARSVMDGLEADVVTLALEYDINAIARRGLTATGWRKRLPDDSAPYTSTIVFLVRKGNPKNIRDWSDLARGGIGVITPNPKTSGGARWNYLAAFAYALKQGKTEAEARDFLRAIFKNVPVLDSGARGSTNTFVERGIGDVLLAWENEALLSIRELGPDKFDIVYPSLSILAEPPVTVIDAYCRRHNTCELAAEYLKFLYTEEAQELVAKNNYRPRSAKVLQKYRDRFPDITLVTIGDVAENWDRAQARFFDDGGEFDQIYAAGTAE